MPVAFVVFWGLKAIGIPWSHRVMSLILVLFVYDNLVRRVPVGGEPSWVKPVEQKIHRFTVLAFVAVGVIFALLILAVLIMCALD